MRSKQGSIASNNSCNLFQTSSLKIDEIVFVAECFKAEHKTIRRVKIQERSNKFQKSEQLLLSPAKGTNPPVSVRKFTELLEI